MRRHVRAYEALRFRKIDKARTGMADLLAVLRAFFPQMSAKRLTATLAKLQRPPPVVKTTRQLLSPEHIEEIDRMYSLFKHLPGGCTLSNLQSLRGAHQEAFEATKGLVEIFATYDGDGDGALTLDEFTEMVKVAFPPFRQGMDTTYIATPTAALRPQRHPLNTDRRIFEPNLDFVMAPVKPIGSSEMLVVQALKDHAASTQTLNEKAALLHVSPVVRNFTHVEE